MTKIYHNPRCSKSREALALLEDQKEIIEIIDYLNNPPSEAALAELLKMLGISAEELLRKGEPIFKEKYKGKSLTESEWIQAMIAHPKLIERPIVMKNGRAVIGRPPQKVVDIL